MPRASGRMRSSSARRPPGTRSRSGAAGSPPAGPRRCSARCGGPFPASARRGAAGSGGSPAPRRPACRGPGRPAGGPCRRDPRESVRRRVSHDLSLAFPAVPAERPRRREFAQPVADHLLGHEDLQVQLAVVDHERMADELGHDRACASPRLDRLLRAHVILLLHFQKQLGVDERALFSDLPMSTTT